MRAYRGVLESFPHEAVMLLGDLDTAYSLAERQPVVHFLAANSADLLGVDDSRAAHISGVQSTASYAGGTGAH